uniref:Uncharacterized protein n=1 Tax=Spongospora subterranea TaxID=70186 RepID=A0A0H5QL20_9EUKA|eukprot:CRZ02713.1 hypothetical protein [Spongospora subterranea]
MRQLLRLLHHHNINSIVKLIKPFRQNVRSTVPSPYSSVSRCAAVAWSTSSGSKSLTRTTYITTLEHRPHILSILKQITRLISVWNRQCFGTAPSQYRPRSWPIAQSALWLCGRCARPGPGQSRPRSRPSAIPARGPGAVAP